MTFNARRACLRRNALGSAKRARVIALRLSSRSPRLVPVAVFDCVAERRLSQRVLRSLDFITSARPLRGLTRARSRWDVPWASAAGAMLSE